MSEDRLRRRKPTEIEEKDDTLIINEVNPIKVSENSPNNDSGEDIEKNAPIKEVVEEIDEKTPKGPFLQRAICYLFEEEDSSYLAAFRALWGIIMMLEVSYHIRQDFAKMTHRYYLNPYGFNFKYYPFEWVTLMSFEWTAVFLYALFLSALFVTIGLHYRLSTVFFFFGICYLFLVESTNYLNHVYLVCVIAGVLIFVPCNCYLSMDAYKNPSLKRETVPKYSPSFYFLILKINFFVTFLKRIYLFTLRSLLFIVYTYAGVVKINEDWLRAEPLRHWLGKDDEYSFQAFLFYFSHC